MKHKFAKISCTKNGFTLTEILVVILIIVILASLIFMGMKKGREYSDTAVCLNNLRNIATGIELYQQDHNGHIPAANFGPSSQKPPLEMYRVALPPYVYGENATTDATGKVTMESGGNVFSCPGCRREYGATTIGCTYGFNNGIRYTGSSNQANLKKINISQPSKTMIMMDGSNAYPKDMTASGKVAWYFEVSSDGTRRPKERDFVHSGKVNVLFVDGHMESRTKDAIPKDGQDPFWKYDSAL